MLSGTTLAVADITIPPEKADIIANSDKEVESILRSYRRGLVTELERDDSVIKVWQETTKKVANSVASIWIRMAI